MLSLADYTARDALGLAELVRDGGVTPLELVEAALAGCAAVNPRLNAIVSLVPEETLRRDAATLPSGPFTGVPYVLKELGAHAAGMPYRLGSRLSDGLVLPHDTELVTRFRRSGAHYIGTTPTPELGFSVTSEAVLHGPSRNPWNPACSPGGSSGGSAAAVAAGIVPFAHANDGGGSIRIPASCCGLVGLKTTRGRTPSGPDFGDPLSGLGVQHVVTRTVRDSAALLDALAGPDAGAPNFAPPPDRPYLDMLRDPPRRLRIAWTDTAASGVAIHPEIVRGIHDITRLCEELGHEMVEAAPPLDWEPFLRATTDIWIANLAADIDFLSGALGRTPSPDTLEACTLACYHEGLRVTTGRFLAAQAHFNTVSRAVGQFFQGFDAVLSPVTARPTLPLGTIDQNAPGVDALGWARSLFDYAPFTALYNTTGQPAISLPLAWTDEGGPIGLQFAGRFADEATLLGLAGQLEQARPWAARRPGIHAAA